MWRNRRLRLLLASLLVAAIASVVGLLENILTNEKHPSIAVLVGLICAVALGAIVAWRAAISSDKREVDSAQRVQEIKGDTEEILSNQKASTNAARQQEVEQLLTGFPYLLREPIRDLWEKSPKDVYRVIGAVGDQSTKPASVLSDWQQAMPGWLSAASGPAKAAAAELANAYGANDLAARLFCQVAAEAGRAPYWTARAALVLYLHDQVDAARRALTDGGVNSDTADSFARITFHLVEGDREKAEQLSSQWAPERTLDTFLRGTIRVAVVFIDHDDGSGPSAESFATAIQIYRELRSKIPQSAAIRVGLAGCLIGIVAAGASTDKHRDLADAIEEAIAGRDLLRDSRNSSVKAVELACQAAYTDFQPRKTIQMGTTVPGEASAEEASSDAVRTLVAAASLLLGEREIAGRAILELTDPFRKAILVAMSAEADERPAATHWRAALGLARNLTERGEALLGLARTGEADPDEIESLRSEDPQQAALIDAVSAAASGNIQQAISQLRTLQGDELNAVSALASAYMQAGDAKAAADALREGAVTLNEPRLRVEAARLLYDNGDTADAIREMEALLVDSGATYALRYDCLGILAEWAAETRDWSTAQSRFRELLSLSPGDVRARWALILVLLQRGKVGEARRVWDEAAPAALEMSLPAHARAWMAMRSDVDRADSVRFVSAVIAVAERFPYDEDVQAESIMTVLSPDSRNSAPLPADAQEQFNRHCERFFTKWPQSPRLRRYGADDVQALLAQMEELVRPSQEAKRLRAEIADQLARNTLPWAALSALTGRTYSEIIVVRGGGIIPAASYDNAESQICFETARAALNQEVVLDISAGGVLLEISDLRDKLRGQFRRLLISAQQRLDALEGERSLRGRSTSTWTYDEQNDRGRLVEVSPDVAEHRHHRAAELVTLVSGCKETAIIESARMRAMGALAHSTWVTTIECAAQTGAYFWCDDVALRAAARSIGVPSFSTPALIDVLVGSGVVTTQEREAAIRSFIESFVGDFPIEEDRLSALASGHDWKADPVASVFSRRASWFNIISCVQIWSRLCRRAAGVDRSIVPDWLYYAMLGLSGALVDEGVRKEPASGLLGTAISFVLDDPDQVARCVIATRRGLGLPDGPSDLDPLAMTVSALRANLARTMGIALATSYVSRVFSTLSPDDRMVVLQVLYGQ